MSEERAIEKGGHDKMNTTQRGNVERKRIDSNSWGKANLRKQTNDN